MAVGTGRRVILRMRNDLAVAVWASTRRRASEPGSALEEMTAWIKVLLCTGTH